MKRRVYRGIAAILTMVSLLWIVWQPMQAYALTITPMPENTRMNTLVASPVYAVPDVNTVPVVFLERFVNVTVTGVTDNGFYQIDLNGDYYVPGVCLVQQLEPAKTEKQKALDNLRDFATAYSALLEQMESYSSTFALIDVTGDGIPELFDSRGREIYTYYDKRAVMMYYSENPTTFYYAKKSNVLVGKYTFGDKERWEVYTLNKTLLPWGQFQCYNVDASPYKNNLTTVTRSYNNDAETRGNMYDILKKILSL